MNAVVVESAAFGLTSNLDPINGAVLEHSVGRSITPYVVAFITWLIVLVFRFIYWNMRENNHYLAKY